MKAITGSARVSPSCATSSDSIAVLLVLEFQAGPMYLAGRARDTYQISAAWHTGGKLITQERTVNVAPGARVAVDFNPERLPPPK